MASTSVLGTDVFTESRAIIGVMADRLVGLGVTRREAEVLAALGEHLSNAEIAARLYVSERTVESHVSSLLGKFHVTNRRELARLSPASTSRRPPDEDGPPATHQCPTNDCAIWPL